ncbi:MAG: TylF/MycF/NovP-related O-methyltransferase [Alphaproteobacteria bacterium]|nr:TylF/MycF/NovP-related O-methyltransferase [Alphaproteobacteria bacterium]
MARKLAGIKSSIGRLAVRLGVDRMLPPDDHVLFTHDLEFHEIYEHALRLSGSYDAKRRRPRNYNTISLLGLTRNLDGEVAEAGCYKGMSSLLICRYLQKQDPNFTGKGFTVFDSFEGLSAPLAQDGGIGQHEGQYASTMEHVAATLSEFPEVTFRRGWIPDCFPEDKDIRYRFVHVDVDLYQPILDSLEYFWPRMTRGGIIVLDDYGSMLFPGAKTAVDEFCEREAVPVAHLSTMNAFIIKP